MTKISPIWDSPWGFKATDPAPEKAELFPDKDCEWKSTDSMEDFLQHNGVFYNLLRGEDATCHSDSYMTGVHYKRLDACLALLVETYAPTAEDWNVLTRMWLEGPNTQPPLKQIASQIRRQYEEPAVV